MRSMRSKISNGSSYRFAIGLLVMVLSFTAQTVAADPGNSNCDAVFEKGGWTEKKIVDTTSGSAATFFVTQVPTGGNPTFYRSTTHKFGKGAIIVAHLKTSAVYDPANQGGIATIEYSYDLRHFTDSLGAVGYRFLVYQNNTYYGGPMNEVYNNAWQNFPGANLDATKFQKIAGGGASNPDFSATGAPITFGYLTANSHPTQGATITKTSGIDNWCFTIIKAPCYAGDKIFANANWQASKIKDTTNGTGATFPNSQVSTGGNLAEYRRVTHTFGEGAIVVAHLNSQAVYDPASQGALASVSYSYDLRYIEGPAGGAVGYQLLVFQNNTYYGGPMNEIYSNAWLAFTGLALDYTKFNKIFGAGPAKPDFSCSGAPITFGYLSANSHTTPNATQTKTSGLDNWCVTLIKAPPPAPLNPDFKLTATMNSGNATTFSLLAEPVDTSGKFWWKVIEIDAQGNEVGTALPEVNPPVWWNPPYITQNDFTTSGGSTFGSPGIFQQGKIYRVTRGMWGPCNPWKAISKTVFMCTTCKTAKVQVDNFVQPRPATLNR